MANWWKCQVLSNEKVTLPFAMGDLVYAKGDVEWIMLFDGRREIMIHKMAAKNVRFLSRLGQEETGLIERDYQLKKAAKIARSVTDPLKGAERIWIKC